MDDNLQAMLQKQDGSGSQMIQIDNAASTVNNGFPLIPNPYSKRLTVTSPSPTTTHQILPLEKKYIGGAERARLLARKKANRPPATRILRPGESMDTGKTNTKPYVLPVRMNSMERFCAALLHSTPQDFLESESSSEVAQKLWQTCCSRVGLPCPTSPIQPVYECKKLHYQIRAALVLEEARAAISVALKRTWSGKQKVNRITNSNTINLVAKQGDNKGILEGHRKISFQKLTSFTTEELFHIRPGSIFQFVPRDCKQISIQTVLLGIVNSNNRSKVMTEKMFTCIFCRENDLPVYMENSDWIAIPLCQLVGEQRAFEAMTINPGQVPFCSNLMGLKRSNHIRFDDVNLNDNSPGITIDCNSDSSDVDSTLPKIEEGNLQQNNLVFKLPRLNATQNRAAKAFLSSEHGSLTLIQGPPGTGKTTLLVSVICQYILENGVHSGKNHRRLMVCAPTNKAVSLLASRFMSSVKQNSYGLFNAILVGDGDKLLSDERSSSSFDKVESSGMLDSIFLFTWMNKLVDEYRKIKKSFCQGLRNKHSGKKLHDRSKQLEERLLNGLPFLSQEIINKTKKLTDSFKRMESGEAVPKLDEIIDDIIRILTDVPQDVVCSQLLSAADVIFCTLSSAGGAALRKTNPIHDLIVDEAAAATEPEICIPLHLQPNRLLAVGDPLQLPATVLSRRATELGLTKSLHERLMFDCNFDHIMLDVQYRMNTEISNFPSKRFYGDRILNGENVSSITYVNGPRLLDGKPYTCLQVTGSEKQSFSGSYSNEAEANKLVELVQDLQKIVGRHDPLWYNSERIRIITFYQSQVTLIKGLLRRKGFGDKIVVATVDSSQGCEADIVLISFVRSTTNINDYQSVGFLSDDRRINVALTRAKYQLICIGNFQRFTKLEKAETIRLLATDASYRNNVWPREVLAVRDMNAPVDLYPEPTSETHLDWFYDLTKDDESPVKRPKYA